MLTTRMALILVFFGLLAGCKKDDTNPANVGTPQGYGIHGRWQVSSGDAETKFLLFNTDNTYFGLREANYGFRALESGVCQITATQVNFRGELYNYSIAGDELRITNTTQTIVCTRNATAPDASQWVATLIPIDSLVAPNDQMTDIAYNAGFLWYGNGYSTVRKLHKINVATRSATVVPSTSVDFTQYAFAVEYANGSLWCNSNGGSNLYKVDPNTGTIQTTSIALGPWMNGIAFDGQYLWAASGNDRTIYKYNPATNSIAGSYSDARAEGLAFAGTTLYVCKDGVVNKCTTTPLRSVAAFRIPGAHIGGIAFDGTHFWLVARVGAYPAVSYIIYKAML